MYTSLPLLGEEDAMDERKTPSRASSYRKSTPIEVKSIVDFGQKLDRSHGRVSLRGACLPFCEHPGPDPASHANGNADV